MASIGIVDNDELTLAALSGYLSTHVGGDAVRWNCTLGRKAIDLCSNPATRPDLLLLDMSLSDMPGTAVCHTLRARLAVMPILAITSFPLHRYAQDVAQAGGQGIIAKRNLRHISAAIQACLREGTWSDDAIPSDPTGQRPVFQNAADAHRRLIRIQRGNADNSDTVAASANANTNPIISGTASAHTQSLALSEREEMFMELLAQGLGNADIAMRMDVTDNTVKTYARRAMSKLGAATRSQAMALWISRKLGV